MRSRRGLAFRPSLAVSDRLECLEDRRLLSALGVVRERKTCRPGTAASSWEILLSSCR